VPVKFFAPLSFAHPHLSRRILPLFTSMFLHGGWLHFLGNMLYLYIFGVNVEDRLGHVRYLFFFILCGMLAAGVHLITNQGSRLPTIGSSGAIAGVMGAYFFLFPYARVVTLIFIFFFIDIVEIPAFFFLAFWFLLQFFSGTVSFGTQDALSGGVAWWAHIGGFVAGIVLLLIFGANNIRWPR
jgi:membrane associated rhomboid family serine protease